MNSRRSFLKTIAMATFAAPAAIKAMLARKDIRRVDVTCAVDNHSPWFQPDVGWKIYDEETKTYWALDSRLLRFYGDFDYVTDHEGNFGDYKYTISKLYKKPN